MGTLDFNSLKWFQCSGKEWIGVAALLEFTILFDVLLYLNRKFTRMDRGCDILELVYKVERSRSGEKCSETLKEKIESTNSSSTVSSVPAQRKMDETRLIISHGGSWVGNYYDGGETEWALVPRGLTHNALVKAVQDVVNVDVARFNIELWSLVNTNSRLARPKIKNDRDVTCLMREDKVVPEVYVTVCEKAAASHSVIEDEDCEHGSGPASVGGYGCAGSGTGPSGAGPSGVSPSGAGPSGVSPSRADPSGFARFRGDTCRDDRLGVDEGVGDGRTSHNVGQSCKPAIPRPWHIPGSEKYSFQPISTEQSTSDNGRFYKGKLFQCKNDLKRALRMYAQKEHFKVRIRRSCKTRFEAGCKDEECEFQLRAIKREDKGDWFVRIFLKKHTCTTDAFHAQPKRPCKQPCRRYKCSKCGEEGHNVARCPSTTQVGGINDETSQQR
ncbi:hypothetical protein LWI29_036963 [Acer saccharum]|uniref:CCHC-type domain-containing protein n=1 Tax=Acer saccharum TaxID=4024 RepID=A0AA39SZK0_ACESA|nr:hypothetical protein LWI29_036963 [Acer saccharum]